MSDGIKFDLSLVSHASDCTSKCCLLVKDATGAAASAAAEPWVPVGTGAAAREAMHSAAPWHTAN